MSDVCGETSDKTASFCDWVVFDTLQPNIIIIFMLCLWNKSPVIDGKSKAGRQWKDGVG